MSYWRADGVEVLRCSTCGRLRTRATRWQRLAAWGILVFSIGLLMGLLAAAMGCSVVYDSQTTDRTVKDSLTVDPKPLTVAPDGRVTGGACFKSEAHE